MSIQVYDGSGYLQIPGTPGPQSFAHVGPTAPEEPEVGQMWVDDSSHLIDQWDDEWQYPVLLNGWVEYNTAVYGPARYRKLPGGLVNVVAMIKNGPVGDVSKPAFILPAGYRPGSGDSNDMLTVPATNVNNNHCRILVGYTSGYVQVHVGDPYWVSIHFSFVAGN